MKLGLWLLPFFTSMTLANTLSGGFLRVFFYYAYYLETEAHGGKSVVIAPGCSTTGRCGFNDFIRWINGVTTNFAITSDSGFDIDIYGAAYALNSASLTGDFDFMRILPGTAPQNVGSVIDIVTLTVYDAMKANHALWTATAGNGTLNSLMAHYNQIWSESLSVQQTVFSGLHPQATFVPGLTALYSGNKVYSVNIWDVAATAGANPSLGIADLNTVRDKWQIADPASSTIFYATRDAYLLLTRLTASCAPEPVS
jgi:hypothetical protein